MVLAFVLAVAAAVGLELLLAQLGLAVGVLGLLGLLGFRFVVAAVVGVVAAAVGLLGLLGLLGLVGFLVLLGLLALLGLVVQELGALLGRLGVRGRVCALELFLHGLACFLGVFERRAAVVGEEISPVARETSSHVGRSRRSRSGALPRNSLEYS